jgi:hypothetical protein
MLIDTNSIIINNISMAQYITEVTYAYGKLWGPDTGRNLKGKMTGSFVGVTPKLKLKFRRLTRAELELLVPILDSENQTTTYYDPLKKQNLTITTYTGDWETTNKNMFINVAKINEPFEISVIAVEPRA